MAFFRSLARYYVLFSLVSGTVFLIKFYPSLEHRLSGTGPAGADPKSALAANPELLPKFEGIVQQAAPENAAAHLGMGVLYQSKGFLSDAERMYLKATALEPDHADAWLRLGMLYQSQSRWAEAASAYERSLAAKPDQARARNDLGLVYEEMGRREEALKSYEEAVRLDPESAVLQDNLANARRDFETEPPQTPLPEPPAPEMAAVEPIEQKRVVLQNGRSLVGEILEENERGLWLQVGDTMKTFVSRAEIERIEDAA